MNDLGNKTSDHSSSHLKKLLRTHHINPTQQRLEIASILFNKHQHISADQVLDILSRANKRVSKATVYNSLGLFAENGLLREVIVDPTKVFYDTNTSQHHHFYNTSTGKLEDIGSDEILIHKLPSQPKGTKIDSVEIILKISHT